MPDYSRDQILQEVDSGQDAKRRAAIDAEVAKAKAGDPGAIQRIQGLADLDGPGGMGAATRDARNYARMVLNENFGGQHEYMEKGDGGGFIGSVGDVLKTAAPFAAPLIPGIGWLGAGALAAGASAAGGELAGDDFDLKKTVLAGAGGAGGNLLLGNKGLAGIRGIPSRLGLTGGGGGAGNVTATGTAGTQGSPDILGKIGNFVGGGNGLGLDDLMKAAGTVSAIDAQRGADQARSGAVQGATDEWNQRAPLRAQAMAGIQNLPNVPRPDMSHITQDFSNPYYRGPRPLTQRYQANAN